MRKLFLWNEIHLRVFVSNKNDKTGKFLFNLMKTGSFRGEIFHL
jgi:hypothetical protein